MLKLCSVKTSQNGDRLGVISGLIAEVVVEGMEGCVCRGRLFPEVRF